MADLKQILQAFQNPDATVRKQAEDALQLQQMAASDTAVMPSSSFRSPLRPDPWLTMRCPCSCN